MSDPVVPPHARKARIQSILDDCLSLPHNVPLDESAIVARYPDLMPELGQQLRFLKLARRAQSLIDTPQEDENIAIIDSTVPSSTEADSRDSIVCVACPSCHERIELDPEANWSQVTCRNCRQTFGLIDDELPSDRLPPGQCIGRFRLIDRIGGGGFGTVWRAIDPDLDRTVALKIPRRGDLTAAEAELFLREARLAAQIRHPHIVSIYEVGRDGEHIYLVSDYIEGQTLAERMQSGRLPQRQSIQLVHTIAQALHAVHQHGVIHRDLKPANILLDDQNQPYVADFGLAFRRKVDLSITFDGQIVGTPAYMSPEQARGDSHYVDLRSDIYSLGVILFELLTGELPFRGEAQVLLQCLEEQDVPSPRRLNPLVPRDLETICLKCLEKEPRRRYASANDLADDLQRFQLGHSIKARPASLLAKSIRWCHRNPTAAALIMLVSAIATFAPMVAGWALAIAASEQSARQEAQNAHLQRSQQLYVARVKSIQDLMEKKNFTRAREVLHSLIPENDEPDLRDFEWHYWRAELERGLEIEFTGYGYLEAVAVSHDGRWLAFGGSGGKTHIYDTQQNRMLQFFPEPKLEDGKDKLYRLEFAPGSSQLAIGLNGQRIIVWDPNDGETIAKLNTVGQTVRTVAFSPDGSLLVAGTWDGTLEVWDRDPESGVIPADSHRSERVSDQMVNHLAISPDGQQLAAVGRENERVKTEFRICQSSNAHVVSFSNQLPIGGHCLRFLAADGSILADHEKSPRIVRFHPSTLEELQHYVLPSRSTSSLFAVSPDGSVLVAGGTQGEMVSWQIDTGELLDQWSGHTERVMDVAFFPDGNRFASVGRDGAVRVWSTQSIKQPIIDPRIDNRRAFSLLFSPDSRYLYTSHMGGRLCCWNTDTRKLLWENECDPGTSYLAMLGNGEELLRSHSSGVHRFFRAIDGVELDSISPPTGDNEKFVMSVSSDGDLLAMGEGIAVGPPFSGEWTKHITLWNAGSRKLLHRWLAHDRGINALHFSRDGEQLLSLGFDKVVRRWDWKKQQLLMEYSMGLDSAFDMLTLDSDQVILVVDSKGTIWRWSLEDGTMLPQINLRNGMVRKATISPGGSTLAVCFGEDDVTDFETSGLVQLIDTRTWDEKMSLNIDGSAAYSVQFSNNSRYLAVGDIDGRVWLWSVPENSGVLRTIPEEEPWSKL